MRTQRTFNRSLAQFLLGILSAFAVVGCSIPDGRWENMPYLSPTQVQDVVAAAVGRSPRDGQAMLAQHRFACELLNSSDTSRDAPVLTCLRPPYEFAVYTKGQPKPGYRVEYEIKNNNLASYRLEESWAKR